MPDIVDVSRADIARQFFKKGIECSDLAIEEAPLIHTAWNLPLVAGDPSFPRYRAVEDAVLDWYLENKAWPTHKNLIDHLATLNNFNRAKARQWVKEAIDAGPWRCFIRFAPADATDYTALPTVRAVRSKGGEQLVYRCPYCERKHFHGASGDGHRISHCDRGWRSFLLTESPVLDEWRITLVREVVNYVAARSYFAVAQQLWKEAS